MEHKYIVTENDTRVLGIVTASTEWEAQTIATYGMHDWEYDSKKLKCHELMPEDMKRESHMTVHYNDLPLELATLLRGVWKCYTEYLHDNAPLGVVQDWLFGFQNMLLKSGLIPNAQYYKELRFFENHILLTDLK